MKVFISWSGKRSKAVAEALRDWLPYVLQSVDPWISSGDIDIGARWNMQINTNLEFTKFGIICLTRRNRNSPWILFESGALAKTIDETYVCPYLVDLDPSDIEGPMRQFQASKADKEGTFRLILSINQVLGDEALSRDRLGMIFAHWWPDLEEKLDHLPEHEEMLDNQCPSATEMKVEGIYENRGAALERFAEFLDAEIEKSRSDKSAYIWFVCSSLKGFTLPSGSQKFNGTEMLEKIAKSSCDIRFIMTHPDVADIRAAQEGRTPGEIPDEIRETVSLLKGLNLRRESIRFYRGTPTVFAIATSAGMLLNPYPYERRSHYCFSLIVHATSSIYRQYFEAHFESPWEQRSKKVPRKTWKSLS